MPKSKKTAKKQYQPLKPPAKQQETNPATPRKVLHVGCGPARKENMHKVFHGDDWQEVRLDITEAAQPDIIGDIRNMPAVDDESMDAVYSSHNVEHVHAYEVPSVMKEFYRVLRPAGFAVITLPDAQAVAFHIANGKLEDTLYESPAGPITPLEIMYGLDSALRNGEHYMAHKTAFTAHTLARYMMEAGFHNVKVERDQHYNLWAQGFKPDGKRKMEHKANIRGRYPFAVVTVPTENFKPDELEVEPKQWKPLNIAKA